jgi:antitoxin component YwqK of YwqJK toxin-antitoxin module
LNYLIIIICCFLFGCQTTHEVTYNPDIFGTNNGVFTQNGVPFSGILIKHHPLSIERTRYKKGKKHGKSTQRNQRQVLVSSKNFKNGRCFGRQQTWFQNGQKQKEYFCNRHGRHGNYKEWYNSGAIYKQLTFKNGHEDGVQSAWFSNGQLQTRYIMKRGRRFGILGVKLCKPKKAFNRLKPL